MIIKKRILIYPLLLVSIILFVFLTACKTQQEETKEEPEIKATLSITKLSDKDFEDIGTQNVVKEDFRNITFTLNVNNCTNITNRKISVPYIKEVMNSYDIERYWYGKGTSFDYPREDALYSNDIMFYSKGLDDESIKSVFKNAKISISWMDKVGDYKEKMINLIDLIEFK